MDSVGRPKDGVPPALTNRVKSLELDANVGADLAQVAVTQSYLMGAAVLDD